MSIAERMRKVRAKTGWGQEKLAHLLGVSRPAVQKYENGKSIPRADILVRFEELERNPVAASTKPPPEVILAEAIGRLEGRLLERIDQRFNQIEAQIEALLGNKTTHVVHEPATFGAGFG